MLVVSLMCVVCAMLRFGWNAYRQEFRQEQAVLAQFACSAEYCDVAPAFVRRVVPEKHRSIFRRVTALRLSSVSHEQQVADLAQLRYLRELELDCSANAGPVLPGRLSVKQLEDLTVVSSGLTDEDMLAIGTLAGLKRLSAPFSAEMTEIGFSQLQRLTRLESLTTYSADVPDEAFQVLRGLKHLKHLAVTSDTMTDSGAVSICSLKNLRSLTLAARQVRSLAVADMPQLSSLTLDGESLETLKLERLPALEYAGWIYHTWRALRTVVLKDVPALESLEVYDAPLSQLRLQNAPSLHTLLLPGVAHVPEIHVEGAVGIRCVQLSGVPATDDDLRRFGVFPGIEALVLDGTQITNDGLHALADFKNLRLLELSYTAVTDTGLPQLVNLESLEEVALTGTEVTEEGVRRFQEQRPNVRVIRMEETAETNTIILDDAVPLRYPEEPR